MDQWTVGYWMDAKSPLNDGPFIDSKCTIFLRSVLGLEACFPAVEWPKFREKWQNARFTDSRFYGNECTFFLRAVPDRAEG